MNIGNIHDKTTVIPFLATAARTTTANGTGIDIKDYTGKINVVLDSAAGTGTSRLPSRRAITGSEVAPPPTRL